MPTPGGRGVFTFIPACAQGESKNAKCVLITSTIPGEGKSFTTTNLALTFAAHGEKVIVVDCDLRKPNIHKLFRMENLKGVIDVCSGKAAIADVVIRNVQPTWTSYRRAGGRRTRRRFSMASPSR